VIPTDLIIIILYFDLRSLIRYVLLILSNIEWIHILNRISFMNRCLYRVSSVFPHRSILAPSFSLYWIIPGQMLLINDHIGIMSLIGITFGGVNVAHHTVLTPMRIGLSSLWCLSVCISANLLVFDCWLDLFNLLLRRWSFYLWLLLLWFINVLIHWNNLSNLRRTQHVSVVYNTSCSLMRG
jgi:hypothetical protein